MFRDKKAAYREKKQRAYSGFKQAIRKNTDVTFICNYFESVNI